MERVVVALIACWDMLYSYGPSPLENTQLALLECHVKHTPTKGSLVNFYLPI
jgi:hypothetical protein